MVVAALLLGGLMILNPGNLRGLILADQAGYTAFGLLAFGFAVTFGSTAMGSAIMALGQDASGDRASDRVRDRRHRPSANRSAK